MCVWRHISYDVFFFFFQAEDGIRDLTVTGVQTCALPISSRTFSPTGSMKSSKASQLSVVRCQSDRKSTRLNSSHSQISYAVFCLKKKKQYPSGCRIATQLQQVLCITHMSPPSLTKHAAWC